MSSAAFRILMAAYLAIWSPALCCCGIKSSLAWATGAERSLSCVQAVDAVKPAAESGCSACARKATRSCCVGLEASPRSAADQGKDHHNKSCDCHGQTDKHVRIDTGVKLKAPPLALAILQLDVLSVSILPAEAGSVVPAWIDSDAGPPAAATSLYGRRCLLLI